MDWGREVGCKIRFDDRSSPETYIKLMTDGILLAETQGDPLLSEYNAIIIDEAHERSLNIDFLLGYLKGPAGETPRAEADHHFGNDRYRGVFPRIQQRADHRGLRPVVPGGSGLCARWTPRRKKTAR